MTSPFAYYCSISDGIYFTPAFTHSGAITWSAVTNVGLFDDKHDCFAVDPFNPLDRQYVFCEGAAYGGAINPREVYTRNGGNWSKILDIEQAETISGVPVTGGVGHLQTIWCDPTVDGSVYVGYYPQGGAPKHVLKSLDCGATWTSIEVELTDLTNLWEFKVYGDSIWVQNGRDTLQHSPDGGENWYQAAAVGQQVGSGVCVNPADTTEAYMATYSAYDLEYHKYAAGAVTKATKQAGSFLANAVAVGNIGTMETMWIDPTDGDHQRIVKSGGTLYYTNDKWANKTETLTDIGATPRHLTNIQGSTGTEADMVVVAGGTLQVIIYDDEDDTTGTDRSGSGGTAVVGDACRYGLWVGYAPVDTGIYVYSVEEDAILDINTVDGLGMPMFGDRSSWRIKGYDELDEPTALAEYHAEDVWDAEPIIHNPWPAISGQVPVSDGSKWVAGDVPGAHDPVTLDVDAAVILDLTGQEIGLDVQTANTVLAGPATGAANEPTFRALVTADLPAIALNDLSDVDTSGVDAYDVIRYNGATWADGRHNIRKRTAINSDTTLDDTYDFITVDATGGNVAITIPVPTAAIDGLEYAIKRIDDSANTVTISPLETYLIDDNGDFLVDDNGDFLVDNNSTSLEGAMAGIELDSLSGIQVVADLDENTWWII